MFNTLISAQQLAQGLKDSPKPWLILDCGFDLADVAAGRRAYEAGHIPGARYVHLDEDLSAAKTGRNGRHPLPDADAFAPRVAGWGADDDTQIVAYDNAGGMYAARVWCMLRWVGHERVAVLDGGWAAWKAAGLPVSTDPAPAAALGGFTRRDARVTTLDYASLHQQLGAADVRLIVDARAADRFRGENETLDPIGGHIPGARNRFFRDNLTADGRFKPVAQLRQEFEAVLQGRAPTDVVHQCGSGVTACHNLLAMEVAGLAGAALYPGSWSEWSAQPGAPVATGA